MVLGITSAKQTCGRKLSQRVEEEKKQRKNKHMLNSLGPQFIKINVIRQLIAKRLCIPVQMHYRLILTVIILLT